MEVGNTNLSNVSNTQVEYLVIKLPGSGEAVVVEDKPVYPQDKKSQGENSYTKEINPDDSEGMEKLQEAIDKTNKILKPSFRHFEMSVHKASHRVMVKVMDSASNELIREIPSEKFLDMVSGFIEMAGLMVDTRV